MGNSTTPVAKWESAFGLEENAMSLRQIAKELGVSHTLLGLWRQGKRSLAPELEARYHQLVTSDYKSGYNATSGYNQSELRNSLNLMERKMGFEARHTARSHCICRRASLSIARGGFVSDDTVLSFSVP